MPNTRYRTALNNPASGSDYLENSLYLQSETTKQANFSALFSSRDEPGVRKFNVAMATLFMWWSHATVTASVQF